MDEEMAVAMSETPTMILRKGSLWWYDFLFLVKEVEKAGFDQVPTGSNWDTDKNMGAIVDFCRPRIAPERLKGFLMASWMRCIPEQREKLLASIDQLAEALV